MNIDQFRAIYPEYKAAKNEAIARKLNETLYPNLKYEDIVTDFFTRPAVTSTISQALGRLSQDGKLAPSLDRLAARRKWIPQRRDQALDQASSGRE
jgi:hypothetical protein